MNPKYKAAWVAALRSGTYKQGKVYLNNNGCFCVMGVLVDIVAQDLGEEWEDNVRGARTYGGIKFRFPEEIAKVCELPLNPFVTLKDSGNTPQYLMQLNDQDGFNFEELANLIEVQL